jgi:hypothetical protein
MLVRLFVRAPDGTELSGDYTLAEAFARYDHAIKLGSLARWEVAW